MVDDVTFLQWIAQGYVRNYRRLSITKWHNWTDLTQAEIRYFAELGTQLGFMVIREEGGSEPRRKDLAWQDFHSGVPILHLERETNDERVVHDAAGKLVTTDSSESYNNGIRPFRVGVFGHVRERTLSELRSFIESNRTGGPILTISWQAEKKEAPKFTVVADIFADSVHLVARGIATIDKDGYWYSSFENGDDGVKWNRAKEANE